MPSDAPRLLIITYHFPPDGAVGGLRWAGIAKYLARLGWNVSVVTAAAPVRSDPVVGAHVEWCPRLRTLNDWYRWLRRPGPGSRTSSPYGSGIPRPSKPPGALRQLRMEAGAFLALPDSGRGWILRAALCTRLLLRRFRPQVVVSSGPPHSAHLVARIATIGSSVRWFIDLRDPWAGPLAKPWQSHPIHRTRIARALLPRLERLAFRAAQGVFTTTPQLTAALAARYPDVPVTCVPNGVDPEGLPPPARDPYPGLGIVYAGTLYGSHDLGPVLQALRIFLERHHEAAQAGSKLRLAGEADAPNARAFEQEVASLGLAKYVEVLGLLPRAQALNVVARSRLAVVLAQDLELVIPAKLYESVAMRIPALVVAGADSAAGVEGRRLGAVVRDPGDVAGIAGVLEQLWRDESRQRPQCPVAITHEAIASLVDRLLGEKRVATIAAPAR
jgi:glycosyltransferase involved in cell wall biosynthesis